MEIFGGLILWILAPIIGGVLLVLLHGFLYFLTWASTNWIYLLIPFLVVIAGSIFAAFCDQRARKKGWK
jgi:CDP-diglyceride synthetase